jgi:hypothetical protein
MLIDLGAHGFVVFVGCLSWVRAVHHRQLHQRLLKTQLSGQPLTHSTNSQDMIYFWWRANKLLYTRPWREAIDEIKVLRTPCTSLLSFWCARSHDPFAQELITYDESTNSSSSSSANSKFRMRYATCWGVHAW